MALVSFSRGDIIWCDFPQSPDNPDYTITGKHMAVILSDDMLPNRTVIVSPISSWLKKDKQGNVLKDDKGQPIHKKLQEFHYGLRQPDYSSVLNQDSYIKLDQIFTFTRETLNGEIKGRLSKDDMFQVDLRLMIVLQMLETLKKIVEHNVSEKANQEA
ncbi:hypothetical protein HMSSN036_52520 [Paenibacillus macerans]|nr:hypothetical protein BK140_37730 [Paenibacillus macerans]GJM73036.1 hypothetical protein HMSSN036_52520 [Paenibacillus macerans]